MASIRQRVISELAEQGIYLRASLPEIAERIVKTPRDIAVRIVELYASNWTLHG